MVIFRQATIQGAESVHLVEHVEGQQCEAQVVDHHGTSAGERLPVLHVLGPQPHDQEIDDGQREGGQIVVQQQQASHPLIWTQMENVVARNAATVLLWRTWKWTHLWDRAMTPSEC